MGGDPNGLTLEMLMGPQMSGQQAAPAWSGEGLKPWDYQVPRPQLPAPPEPHVDFETFPGGQGPKQQEFGPRARRQARKAKRWIENPGTSGNFRAGNKQWGGRR